MSTEVNSQPPVAWRYCGSQIKMWRAEAGVGRDALAKEAGYDYEYVKSVTPPPRERGGFSLCRWGFATDQPGP